jgi:hypothetical protein
MLFNYQSLKCIRDTQSVSGTHKFVKGEKYRFAVIKHNDDSNDWECVFKYPHHNGELVDTRQFEDYDVDFMDLPCYQVVSTFETIDKKNRKDLRKEILYGGSFDECIQYFDDLKEEYRDSFIENGVNINQFIVRGVNRDETISIIDN